MDRAPVPLEAVAAALRTAELLREIHGWDDVDVRGITQDSRDVESGDLFFAWKGDAHDAHDFLVDAAEGGAVAAIVERPISGAPIPQIEVTDGRLAAAIAADRVTGSPWKRLFTAAITGTNGKTTTASLARHLLAARGRSATVGTLGLVDPDGLVRPGSEGLTTPGPVQVAETLETLVDEDVDSVTFEASSHALEQRRLDGVRFDAVAFTNLGRDHLDYHPTHEAYARSKARLLELRKDGGAAILNRDEAAWDTLSVGADQTLTFGVRKTADLRGEGIAPHPLGIRFELVSTDDRVPVELPLLGTFNVENALAAAGVAIAAGLSLDEIGVRLSSAPQVPGRLEVVANDPFRILIDFAHTPDALRRVLDTLRPLVDGRLIVLFGAGGDRDRSKRPEMGRAVASVADLVVVTSDNPRTEDPDAIIDDVARGLDGVAHLREADREAAIGRAIAEARPGDLVLLAGKGHESYQIVGTESRPFDEARIAREAVARLRGTS